MTRPPLPLPRGPLSTWLVDRLRKPPAALHDWPEPNGHPLLSEDEALSLYICYELHYRGFEGVAEEWEWSPSLLGLRGSLEDRFVAAVATEAGGMPDPAARPGPEDVAAALDRIIAGPGQSLSGYMAKHGTWAQFQEFAIHRSAYQLKEADPHTWAIPRLYGASKAALVTIQKDEYGEGDPSRVHAHLFARTLRALGLSSEYGQYLNSIPAITLSTVNLVSLFGLHRRWRGALVGHLAIFEMASVVPNGNYAKALRRLGLGDEATAFYEVHVAADEHHQRVARNDLAAQLAYDDPGVAADIIFGARSISAVERMFTNHLLNCWATDETSLHAPPVSREPVGRSAFASDFEAPLARPIDTGGRAIGLRPGAIPVESRS